jgi:NADH dehydrogenase
MGELGANADSASSYGRTKGKAEAAILSIVPDAVILRPSIIFGPEDGFFNKFAEMSRFAPALPLIGGGKTKFQPVYVKDVAEAVGRAVDGKLTPGAIYELGGPEVLSFRECLETVLKIVNRKRPLVSVPFGVASLIGSIASLVPLIAPPITPDQVTLLKNDNVVSAAAEAEGRTLSAIGIRPTMLTSVLPSYLVRFRPHGQFSGTGKAA